MREHLHLALAIALLLALAVPAPAAPLIVHITQAGHDDLESYTTDKTTLALGCSPPHAATAVRWSLGDRCSGSGVRRPGLRLFDCTVGPLQPGDNTLTLVATDDDGRRWSKTVLLTCNPGLAFTADFCSVLATVPLGAPPTRFSGKLAGTGLADLDWGRATVDEVTAEGRTLRQVGTAKAKPAPDGAIWVEGDATLTGDTPGVRFYRLQVPCRGKPPIRSAITSVSLVAARPRDYGDPVSGPYLRAFDEATKAGRSHVEAVRAACEAARATPGIRSVELDVDEAGFTYTLTDGTRIIFRPVAPGYR